MSNSNRGALLPTPTVDAGNGPQEKLPRSGHFAVSPRAL